MSNSLEDYENLNVANWDGYDADPVTPQTLALARVLADMFENPPDVAPGNDGSICFEWVDGGNKVFIDVIGDDISFYGTLSGKFFTRRAA